MLTSCLLPSHLSPRGERSPGSLWAAEDRALPGNGLDELAVTPGSSLGCTGGFRLLSKSGSLVTEGEAADLWDWKKTVFDGF